MNDQRDNFNEQMNDDKSGQMSEQVSGQTPEETTNNDAVNFVLGAGPAQGTTSAQETAPLHETTSTQETVSTQETTSTRETASAQTISAAEMASAQRTGSARDSVQSSAQDASAQGAHARSQSGDLDVIYSGSGHSQNSQYGQNDYQGSYRGSYQSGGQGSYQGGYQAGSQGSYQNGSQGSYQANYQNSGQGGYQAGSQNSTRNGDYNLYQGSTSQEYRSVEGIVTADTKKAKQEKKAAKAEAKRAKKAGKQENAQNGAKKPRYWRRALVSVSLGLLFGIFAGLGLYGVSQVTGLTAQEEESQTVLSDQVDNTSQTTGDETAGTTEVTTVTYVTSDVSAIVAEVIPAMVSIVNNYTSTTTYYGRSYTQQYTASGSGIIIGENETELLIATNYHVIESAEQLVVTFVDDSEAEAQVKGTDEDMDLAVISVTLDSLSDETKGNITIAKLGDSDSLQMGEPVIALGNALGYGLSMTGGYVSAPQREITMDDGTTNTFIQTDAAINPGNSGGALVNMNGEVIGINSAKISDTDVEGVGYAIPISAAEPILEELMVKEVKTKVSEDEACYIGIYMQDVSSMVSQLYGIPTGILITQVVEDSPAEEAGILVSDVLVEFDGEDVETIEELQELLEYYAAGTEVNLTVKRLDQGTYVEVELTITLGLKSDYTTE